MKYSIISIHVHHQNPDSSQPHKNKKGKRKGEKLISSFPTHSNKELSQPFNVQLSQIKHEATAKQLLLYER